MIIDSVHFTPWRSLAGGVLIGLAVALFLLGVGRIAGIAGLVARPLTAALRGFLPASERVSLLFLAGLLSAPWLWQMIAPLPSVATDVGAGLVALAGVLVGVGVRMANGCTSGHGVCGLGRFSLRSFVNVCAFMASGMTDVYLLRHIR
jgi:uncharacterized protein